MACGSNRNFFRALIPVALLAIFLVPTPSHVVAASKAKQETASLSDLIWPLPPDPPRVRYVTSLHGSSDFKKKVSRWKRFLLGLQTETGISLRKPYGVTTDSEGRVYVTDTGLGAVVMFDGERREVQQLGGKGRIRLQTPIGIAFDDRDRMFVSDADLDRVFCFDRRGEILLALGGEDELRNPTGLAFDPQRGRLYVADSHLHQIFLYSAEGELLDRWGSRGSDRGQFNFPTNLTLDRDGNLYVVDTGNFRVQVFAPDFTPVMQFGEAGDGFGQFHRPKGIALDSEGHIYVVDAAFNNFQIFDQGSELLLFVGTLGKKPGNFWLPAGIHIDNSDRIYVVDQANARVQIFQYVHEENVSVPDETRTARAPQEGPHQQTDTIVEGGDADSFSGGQAWEEAERTE